MKSPLKYVGGKSLLSKTIVPLIPTDHVCYVEPFCGAAWIFFSKEKSKIEVLNDRDSDLINFYKVLKAQPKKFYDQLYQLPASRQLWTEYKQELQTDKLTDLQRAVRYFYVHQLAFGGKIRCSTFGYSTTRISRILPTVMHECVDYYTDRLKDVTIENLDYTDIIRRYDRSHTFFYVDPPYFRCPVYKHNFKDEDFIQLSEVLTGIKGKFLLSTSDHLEMRKIFKAFNIRKISLSYSIKVSDSTGGNELLISNY